MATKYVRGIDFNTQLLNKFDGGFLAKLIYEFWCYVINGGSSATTPGGLASTTPSTMQADFVGGTSLLCSGTDGATTLDSNVFTASSAPFNSGMTGKKIVIWSPASGSTEDSIYQIIRYQSATEVVLNVNSGGTPAPLTLRPHFTSRTNLRYRVIDDKIAAAAITDTTSRYFVLQLTPPACNPGQANSQVQVYVKANAFWSATAPTDFGFKLSPGGTWTGSAFTDGTTEILSDVDTSGWFSNVGTSTASRTNNVILIGDVDFLQVFISGDSFIAGSKPSSGMHLEIPERIYAADVNPITLMVTGQNSPFKSWVSTQQYGGGFWTIWEDGVLRKSRGVARCVTGDCNPFGGAGPLNSPRFVNAIQGKVLTTPLYIGQHGVSTHWSFVRNKLRKVMLTGGGAATQATRIGTSGEWVHCYAGICWPWDNTILPYNLFLMGGTG